MHDGRLKFIADYGIESNVLLQNQSALADCFKKGKHSQTQELRHLYNGWHPFADCGLLMQFSYMVLNQGVSPVTFSVGNTMKRVAVVVSSVLFFKNPVAALNWIGSGVAIFGTFLYSLAKDKAANEAKSARAATA